MSSVTSMSNASGLSVISVAQAKSQNLLDNFSSKDQALITAAPKSFVMTLSSSGFQAAIVSNALNTDATLTQGNSPDYAAFYTKYNSMSSDEWSSMLYGGGSVPSAAGEQTSDTLQSLLTAQMNADNNDMDMSRSDVAVDQQVLAAFHDKTLTIQKASDVAGLDWRENFAFSSGGGNEMGGRTYNQKFINENINGGVGADGKHHELTGMGPTELYLSW